MDRIRIIGGQPLHGTIPISGAKNAALPLMVASMLTEEPLVLENVPKLADIETMTRLIEGHGVEATITGGGKTSPNGGCRYRLQARTVNNITAPYELVSTMRASFYVIGPLLARCGEAWVSLPGGCAIGTRPVDLHLKGLEMMGAKIELSDGYVHARAPHGLRGGEFRFPFVSVGATANLMMAATLAEGVTVLENAAREPEITGLAQCLSAMGAKIEGIGSHILHIEGQPSLSGTVYSVLPDRIETGTYAMAVAMAGGDVVLGGAYADLLEVPVAALREAGIRVEEEAQGLRVTAAGGRCAPLEIRTEPYPGFPTDLQAQIMALLCRAEGESRITETIFENRFMHVQELARMGADISLHGDLALVKGVEHLKGAPVMATDLRASVSLVIAGLAAEGETIINRVYHLDRGFERIEEKLGNCGACIERLAN